MNRHLGVEPTSDAEVFDMLHAFFGIGDYLDGDAKPYHRFRMVEVAKIKALRKRRGISIDQLAVTARYAYRRGLPVVTVFSLVQYMGAALRERALEKRQALGEQMTAAAADARAMGQLDWANRLLLAQGAHREQALADWRKHQEVPS